MVKLSNKAIKIKKVSDDTGSQKGGARGSRRVAHMPPFLTPSVPPFVTPGTTSYDTFLISGALFGHFDHSDLHMSIKGESWESRIPGTEWYCQALFLKNNGTLHCLYTDVVHVPASNI